MSRFIEFITSFFLICVHFFLSFFLFFVPVILRCCGSGSGKTFLSLRKKVKSLSCVWLFAAPWTVAHQTPPSMEFSRQEYWSGLPFPSPGDLPDPGIEPGSPATQADAQMLYRLSHQGSPFLSLVTKSIWGLHKPSQWGTLYLLLKSMSEAFSSFPTLIKHQHEALSDWSCVFGPKVKFCPSEIANLTLFTVSYQEATIHCSGSSWDRAGALIDTWGTFHWFGLSQSTASRMYGIGSSDELPENVS